MTERRRGLGRGLGALIPTAPPAEPVVAPVAEPTPLSTDPVGDWVVGGTRPEPPITVVPSTTSPDTGTGLVAPAGAWFAEVAVDAIAPNPKQPRQIFDEEAMAELVHSIREIGLLQPVVVRPAGQGRYELIMGERRWRAHQAAGLAVIPAIVRDTADDDLLRDALLENLHRSQLNALEEAAAYRQLLDDFGCTHDELAQRIGRSRPQISNTLRLLKLPTPVQRRVAAGVLSAGHARALLGLSDRDAMDQLAQRIVAEGLSVRTVEEIVALGGDPIEVSRGTRGGSTKGGGTDDILLGAVGERLEERLETRVQVKANAKGRGRITVEFASLEDLRRLVDVIDPTG
jgi:ParB family chromosome partitioning protein